MPFIKKKQHNKGDETTNQKTIKKGKVASDSSGNSPEEKN